MGGDKVVDINGGKAVEKVYLEILLRVMTLIEEVTRHGLRMAERRDLREEKMHDVEIELKKHRLESVRAGKTDCCC